MIKNEEAKTRKWVVKASKEKKGNDEADKLIREKNEHGNEESSVACDIYAATCSDSPISTNETSGNCFDVAQASDLDWSM